MRNSREDSFRHEQFDEKYARLAVRAMECQIVDMLCALNHEGLKRVSDMWAVRNEDKTWPLALAYLAKD